MPKFSAVQKTAVHHPISTDDDEMTVTYEGGSAFGLNPLADLFLLASTNMVGEDTFYEAGSARDERYRGLIQTVVAMDPVWVGRFAPFLRGEMGMRSASIVLACEYVKSGGPHGRQVIASVCQRADEPAEVIGYWLSRYGKKIPMPVKRGVADASRRLYTERNVLRYDGQRRDIRFADVLELCHVKPGTPAQDALFHYLLDEYHHGDGSVEKVAIIREAKRLQEMPEAQRRAYAKTHPAPEDWSWQQIASWLPGPMDAQAWEWAIPGMGVMALMRNLRNFDQAKISEGAIDSVISKLQSADDVSASRIWPLNVWVAYRETNSDNWQRALRKTLELSTQNTPELPGATLILIDTSSSMRNALSRKSTIQRVEVAAVMASAMAKRNTADVVIFGDLSLLSNADPTISALKLTELVTNSVGIVGHGTYMHTAIRRWFDPARHKRVMVFTDDQAHDSGAVNISDVPLIYIFDLGGYGRASMASGERGRFRFGGFSDKLLAALPVLEKGHDGAWPF